MSKKRNPRGGAGFKPANRKSPSAHNPGRPQAAEIGEGPFQGGASPTPSHPPFNPSSSVRPGARSPSKRPEADRLEPIDSGAGSRGDALEDFDKAKTLSESLARPASEPRGGGAEARLPGAERFLGVDAGARGDAPDAPEEGEPVLDRSRGSEASPAKAEVIPDSDARLADADGARNADADADEGEGEEGEDEDNAGEVDADEENANEENSTERKAGEGGIGRVELRSMDEDELPFVEQPYIPLTMSDFSEDGGEPERPAERSASPAARGAGDGPGAKGESEKSGGEDWGESAELGQPALTPFRAPGGSVPKGRAGANAKRLVVEGDASGQGDADGQGDKDDLAIYERARKESRENESDEGVSAGLGSKPKKAGKAIVVPPLTTMSADELPFVEQPHIPITLDEIAAVAERESLSFWDAEDGSRFRAAEDWRAEAGRDAGGEPKSEPGSDFGSGSEPVAAPEAGHEPDLDPGPRFKASAALETAQAASAGSGGAAQAEQESASGAVAKPKGQTAGAAQSRCAPRVRPGAGPVAGLEADGPSHSALDGADGSGAARAAAGKPDAGGSSATRRASLAKRRRESPGETESFSAPGAGDGQGRADGGAGRAQRRAADDGDTGLSSTNNANSPKQSSGSGKAALWVLAMAAVAAVAAGAGYLYNGSGSGFGVGGRGMGRGQGGSAANPPAQTPLFVESGRAADSAAQSALLDSQKELEERVDELDRGLRQAQADLQGLRDQSSEADPRLAARIDANVGRLDELAKRVQDMSSADVTWLLPEIDSTLAIATQQLVLNGDAASAVNALDSLSRRLDRVDSPQLLGLKKAVSDDLSALRKVGALDVVGVALRLDRLRSDVDSLPLAMDAELRKSAAPQTERAGASGGWWNDAYSEFKAGLKSLVVVRKIDNPDAMMLSPDQGSYVRQNIKLRLLDARIALLQRQHSLYLDDLRAAQVEINRFYDVNSQAVRDWQSELDDLGRVKFAAPDMSLISSSLSAAAALRARAGLDAGSILPAPEAAAGLGQTSAPAEAEGESLGSLAEAGDRPVAEGEAEASPQAAPGAGAETARHELEAEAGSSREAPSHAAQSGRVAEPPAAAPEAGGAVEAPKLAAPEGEKAAKPGRARAGENGSAATDAKANSQPQGGE